MKCFMTRQVKVDLLIQVTTWAGLYTLITTTAFLMNKCIITQRCKSGPDNEEGRELLAVEKNDFFLNFVST